jgi:tetratricopeptide (TPR) repeat protein
MRFENKVTAKLSPRFIGVADPFEYNQTLKALLELGEEHLRLGDYDKARQNFEFILDIDGNNQRALRGLAKACRDWWQARSMLEKLLESQPENEAGRLLWEEAQSRCAEFEEFEEVVSLELHHTFREADRKKRFASEVCQPAPVSIRPIGKIMIEVGYVGPQELENTLSLQAMLSRYDQHQPLGKILLDSGYVTEQQLEEVLQKQELEEGRVYYNWMRRQRLTSSASAGPLE